MAKARSPAPDRDLLRFPDVLLVSRFDLMDRFVEEFAVPPPRRDRAALERRWARLVERGNRALQFRLIVTLLLGFSVVATAVAGLMDLSQALGTAGNPQARAAVQGLLGVLGVVQAVAGSAAVVLLVARLALDRYVDSATAAAAMLAAQLASTAPPPAR